MKKTFILMVVVFVVAIFGQASLDAPVSIPVTSALSPNIQVSEQTTSSKIASSTAMVSLDDFISSVTTTGTDALAGIYIPGQFALPILQQPSDSPAYVSTNDGVVTQFAMASQYGSVGLLAHNFLSGQKFFDLQEGMEITLIYGNGNISHYRIKTIERYQALTPESVYSDFVDMADTSATPLDSTQLFKHVYASENNSRLVLQTCIAGENSSSAGRLFVIAENTDN
jgi:hypothetical protein